MPDVFLRSMKRFIREHGLLCGDGTWLVALSGGADSVTLLRSMLMLGYRVAAVHCNFMLRGAESDRDEAFCRALCKGNNVCLHVQSFDTRDYADRNGISIEMAARELRYGFFSRLVQEHGYIGVCVAHNADDNVETVLLNLIRGTGIDGLKGIRPQRDNIVRPMLFATRKEIEAFLRRLGQDWITDSSNLVADVRRNKIRLRLLPVIEELNPNIRRSVLQTADDVTQAISTIDSMMARWWQDKAEAVGDDVPLREDQYRIRKEHICSEHILYHLLQPYGFSPTHIRQFYRSLQSRATARILSAEYQCVKHGDWLYLAPLPREWNAQITVKETDGAVLLPDGWRLTLSIFPRQPQTAVSTTPDCVCLDADKMTFPLVVRKTEKGDRLRPLGADGSQTVSKLLTDLKATPIDRQRQWLLCDAEGNICWVVKRRIAHHCRITPTTKRILQVKIDRL